MDGGACNPRGHKESDMTKRLHFHFHLRTPPAWPKYLPKTPPLNTNTVAVMNPIYEWVGDINIQFAILQFSSVAQSCLTLSSQASLSITNSRAYSNSCPLGWWCHPTISSSVIPFSSCLQSFPESGSQYLLCWNRLLLISCVWLCDPMDCCKSGFPVIHHLLEFARTHVHWVSDAIWFIKFAFSRFYLFSIEE